MGSAKGSGRCSPQAQCPTAGEPRAVPCLAPRRRFPSTPSHGRCYPPSSPPSCFGTWFYSIRWPSWGALRDEPKGDTASSLPPSHPRKARTYRPLPASGCAPTVLLDSDSTAGQSGASPAPTPLAPWGCLDQSCRRLTAGGSSSRTRMTWRSSVPRSPGGGAGQG